jgi:curved DNA-binding protein CbpA
MNYYVILGIPMNADDESIRHAFRVLARRYHPDAGAGSSVEKFHQISEAYETLRDPARRAVYDNSLRAKRPATNRSSPEPLRPEPTRAEPIPTNEFVFRRVMIEQLFDELFRDVDDLFFDPFSRW